MRALLWLSCSLTIVTAGMAQDGVTRPGVADQLGALLDIASGEYALAVSEAGIEDSLEYGETVLLLEEARGLASSLVGEGERGAALAAALDSAEARVERVAAPRLVAQSVGVARTALSEGWGVSALPRPERAPDPERGAALYEANCAICHGSEGAGDGPALSMDPPPTDFTDPVIGMEMSAARMYQVISYGISGTRMDRWWQLLDEQQRWDVVAHMNRLVHSDEERRRGAELYADRCASCHDAGDSGAADAAAAPDLSQAMEVVDLSGLALLARISDGHGAPAPEDELTAEDETALVAHVRTLPERGRYGPATDEVGPVMAQVRDQLAQAARLHETGEYETAARTALQAYMAFEGVERDLRLRAPELTGRLEGTFMEFREAVGGPGGEVAALQASLGGDLQAAEERLSAGASAWSDFLSSLVIIFREGLEAILLIGALLAFLSKSGNREHRPSIYWGATAAIVASLLTVVAIELVFQIAPASQEVLEGVTMLLAVAVLFSVSYWLVSKVQHDRWDAYIRDRMSQALSSRSQLALGAVAFLAVYREGFETVLFYKALVSAAGSTMMVLAGFGMGVLALAVICVAIYRFGVRIPLRPFFALTSAFLYYLAFVFAGQGIRELQEGGVLGTTRVPGVPQVEILGIYPTLETLAVQAVLVAALLTALVWTFVVAPVRLQQTSADSA